MIEWQTNPPDKYMTWHEAVDYAKSLGDGWRLPTRSELVNAYDSDVIGFKKNPYWSSCTYAQASGVAWYVDFSYGNAFYYSKTSGGYVRCVREVKGE